MRRGVDPDSPVTATFSLPRTFLLALDRIASRGGYANRSAVLRQLIFREMEAADGPGWLEDARSEVRAAQADQKAGVR